MKYMENKLSVFALPVVVIRFTSISWCL